MTSKTILFLSLGTCCSLASAMPLSNDTACENDNAGNISQALSCGSIDGSLRLQSYSLNNAYFSGNSQDATAIGGYATYKTAPYHGFQAAIGIEGQHNLDQGSSPVTELGDDTFGLGEAYIKWQHQKFAVTAGNQRLADIPFVGDYSNFRVLPYLYQGIDIRYGDADNFIRATKANKFKSYGTSKFSKGSRLKDDPFIGLSQDTDGMTAIGAAKKIPLGDHYLKGRLWVQHYDDLLNLYYAEANYGMSNLKWQPEISLQGMYGNDTGSAYLGKVDSKVAGIQVKLKPTPSANLKLAYNHMFNEADAYHNGALPTPYAHNTSSGPFFAQPFFTSTQDLGAGNAWSAELTGAVNNKLFMGSRLTHVRASNNAGQGSHKMTEYLLFGTYRFQGRLKGLSISDFAGMQKRQGNDNEFLQNRLQLSYSF
ncbi:hypothetical protein LVJ83_06275 [Uruburuella testudinis]|uniref:Outer membrane OprD family porin n=1 Tax=Uruburuella testudinis TaxID=1282863 RepID=A0ABY4DW62_9NEIS|nr:hypothetical protein [Uruburuella testudinis]UOO83063.1 hypothetical protein LVJ83_06275 [Uruburuella testudinis]